MENDINFNIYKDSQITLHTQSVLALVPSQKQLGIIRFESYSKEYTILAFRKTKKRWTVFLLNENGLYQDRTIIAYNEFNKKEIQTLKTEKEMISFVLKNSVKIDEFYNSIKLDDYKEKRAIIKEKMIAENKQKSKEIWQDMASTGTELHQISENFSHKNDPTLENWEK